MSHGHRLVALILVFTLAAVPEGLAARTAAPPRKQGSLPPMVHITLDTGWTSPSGGSGTPDIGHGVNVEQGTTLSTLPPAPMLGTCVVPHGTLPTPQLIPNPAATVANFHPAQANSGCVDDGLTPISQDSDGHLSLGFIVSYSTPYPALLRIDVQGQAASYLALDWTTVAAGQGASFTTPSITPGPGTYFVQATLMSPTPSLPPPAAPPSVGLLAAGETENYVLTVPASLGGALSVGSFVPKPPWTGGASTTAPSSQPFGRAPRERSLGR